MRQPLLFESPPCVGPLGQVVACAARLVGNVATLTPAERALVRSAPPVDVGRVRQCAALIRGGADPLGDAYCRLRSIAERRAVGAVYTPAEIVASMVAWAADTGHPVRIVDAGAGSGRFLIAAGLRFPKAALVAVETDPAAVLLLRANAAVRGLTARLTVHLADYREVRLPEVPGPTLFIGNPPYVRHHDLSRSAKAWFARTAARYGLKASRLAGLHVYFFLKTRELARPGDYGAFITSAEWLDVNYGAVLRNLLGNGLGGVAVHVLAPQVQPFADAITTGAITCFRVGSRESHLKVRRVQRLADLGRLAVDDAAAMPWTAPKWSVGAAARVSPPAGHTTLGELFAVHRGQVTGANDVWIAGQYTGPLPGQVLFAAVTRARELLAAGEYLRSAATLRRVIDVPADLGVLGSDEREQVERFLAWARRRGAHESYIARHRTPWWGVRLRDPAPILCTYMARRPPAFVINMCGARHLNIAHGLYPRQPLSAPVMLALVRHLNAHVRIEAGRTYAGGLTKFEPREIGRILIPKLEHLDAGSSSLVAGRVGQRRSARGAGGRS